MKIFELHYKWFLDLFLIFEWVNHQVAPSYAADITISAKKEFYLSQDMKEAFKGFLAFLKHGGGALFFITLATEKVLPL